MSGVSGVSGMAGMSGQTAVETMQDLLTTYCAAVFACCPDRTAPSDGGLCLNLAGDPVPYTALANGGVTLDPAVVSACRDALAAALVNCVAPATPGPCNNMYVGTRRQGERCTGAHECKAVNGGSAACALNGASQGTCLEMPRGRAGDACLGTCTSDINSDCSPALTGTPSAVCFESDGLYCDVVATPPICRPIPAVGAACDNYYACGPTNVCLANTTCELPLPQSCATVACHDHLVCIDDECQLPTTFGQTFACFGNFPNW